MKKITTLICSKYFVIGVIIVVLIISAAIVLLNNNSTDPKDMSKIEYRTDSKPIITRFPSLPAFQKCYWKAKTIGGTDFGPTNYSIEGFLVLEEQSHNQLVNKYSWKAVDLKFPKGIEPTVTGFKEFDWRYSEEFESQAETPAFIGYFYYDIENGIIYLTFENN